MILNEVQEMLEDMSQVYVVDNIGTKVVVVPMDVWISVIESNDEIKADMINYNNYKEGG